MQGAIIAAHVFKCLGLCRSIDYNRNLVAIMADSLSPLFPFLHSMKSLLLDGMLWRLFWVAMLLAVIWLVYFAVV